MAERNVRPDIDPETARKFEEALQDMADMMNGEGGHKDHTQEQVGRCVYCSCGMRVQGTLPKRSGR